MNGLFKQILCVIWNSLGVSTQGNRSCSSWHTTVPKNTATLYSDTTFLHCSYKSTCPDDNLYWRRYFGSHDLEGQNVLWEDYPYSLLYPLHPGEGMYDFLLHNGSNVAITNVTAKRIQNGSDFMFYSCWLLEEDLQQLAQLIMLDDYPTCGDITIQDTHHVVLYPNSDQTTLQCHVKFIGFYGPSLVWYDQNNLLLEPSWTERGMDYVISFYNVTNLEDIHENAFFTCHLYFESPDSDLIPPDDPVIHWKYDRSAPLFTAECVVTLQGLNGTFSTGTKSTADYVAESTTSNAETPPCISTAVVVGICAGTLVLVIIIVTTTALILRKHRVYEWSKQEEITDEYLTTSAESFQKDSPSVPTHPHHACKKPVGTCPLKKDDKEDIQPPVVQITPDQTNPKEYVQQEEPYESIVDYVNDHGGAEPNYEALQ